MSKTFVLKHILSIESLFHRRTAILYLHVIERYVLLEDSVVRLIVLIENLDYQYVMNIHLIQYINFLKQLVLGERQIFSVLT
jgi:hypothetical protein